VQRLAAGGKPDSAVWPEQSSSNFSGQRMALHVRFHRHDSGHSGRGSLPACIVGMWIIGSRLVSVSILA